MDDVIKTVKAQLYDRVTSPLSGAFIISWCGWNWRFLILLLSDMSAIDKFSYADITLYPTFFAFILRGFIYPLLTTAFIIFIYPWPARFVYKYWRNQQQKQKRIQQQIEDDEPLTNEKAREIRSRALQLELKYEADTEKRGARIKELESLVKSLQDSISKYEPVIEQKEAQIKEMEGIVKSLQDLKFQNEQATNQKEIKIKEMEDLVKSLRASQEKLARIEASQQEYKAMKEMGLINASNTESDSNTNISEKLKILNLIAEKNILTRGDITKGLSTNERIKIEHYIDELIDSKLLGQKYVHGKEEMGLELLPNGRSAIVKRYL